MMLDNAENPGPSAYSSNSSPPASDFSSGSSDVWEPPIKRQTSNASSENELNNSDEVPLANYIKKKRRKGQGPMQRKLRKARSESPRKEEEYITAKGKTIAARQPLPLTETC